jgi:hypothetical protein
VKQTTSPAAGSGMLMTRARVFDTSYLYHSLNFHDNVDFYTFCLSGFDCNGMLLFCI